MEAEELTTRKEAAWHVTLRAWEFSPRRPFRTSTGHGFPCRHGLDAVMVDGNGGLERARCNNPQVIQVLGDVKMPTLDS
jgi:hypothetical protein